MAVEVDGRVGVAAIQQEPTPALLPQVPGVGARPAAKVVGIETKLDVEAVGDAKAAEDLGQHPVLPLLAVHSRLLVLKKHRPAL